MTLDHEDQRHEEPTPEPTSEGESGRPALPEAICPYCQLQMVEAEVLGQLVLGPKQSSIPWWQPRLTALPSTHLQRALVCYNCGLTQLFVADPSHFRPEDTQTLPRPAEPAGPDTDTLPRTVE